MFLLGLKLGMVVGVVMQVALRTFVGVHLGAGPAPVSTCATNFADLKTLVTQVADFIAFAMVPLGVVGIGGGVIMTHMGYQAGTNATRTSIIGLIFGLLAGVIGTAMSGFNTSSYKTCS